MKKILSILGVIGLTATSTTSLISCEKPNNNENGGSNKTEPKPEKPQQPPKNSSWKIVDVSSKEKLKNELSNFNDWYTVIWKPKNIYFIAKFNSKWDVLTPDGNISFQNYYVNFEYIKSLYHYDNSTNEPELPEIDNNGKITDWKE